MADKLQIRCYRHQGEGTVLSQLQIVMALQALGRDSTEVRRLIEKRQRWMQTVEALISRDKLKITPSRR